MTETIPRSIIVQLLTEAQKNPEREVCGLISSRNGAARKTYPVTNIASTPGTLFEMDPEEQIQAIKSMREGNEELWAIYHSHPHAPAAPSHKDLTDAAYPDALYLVISLNTEGVLEMGGYRLQQDGFHAVELETVE